MPDAPDNTGHRSRLRQRLMEDAREPRYIKTVRSEGYVFAATVAPWQPA